MDQVLKDQWVAALRSGAYKQGQKQLRREGDFFCCLGVLCDLVSPNGWLPGYYDSDQGGAYFGYGYGANTNSSMPSDAMLADVDLPGVIASDLATMNDEGNTFAVIADYIEEHI
jgi:hypothetical protein